MKISILSIGKTKSAACAALEDEYRKRLSGWFRCEELYVKNKKEFVQRVQTFHGASNTSLLLLDEHGSLMTSREFAEFLERSTQTVKHLVFVIGDAQGFPDEVRELRVESIALSEMTFPHEIARVILMEQLYRAKTIVEGHPYHK